MIRNKWIRRRTPCGDIVRMALVVLGTAAVMTIAPASPALAQSTSEIVELSTTVADAIGELRLASSRQRAAAQLKDKAVIPQKDLEEAQIRRETAELKLSFLRDILQSEIRIGGLRRDELRALRQSGEASASMTDVRSIDYRLEILERLLQVVKSDMKTAARPAGEEKRATPVGTFCMRIMVPAHLLMMSALPG